MGNAEIDYTPDVLTNKGVPIKLYVLDEDGNPSFDSEGQVIEIIHLRYDIRKLARIESTFREFEVWEESPEKVLKHTLVEQDGKQVMIPSYQDTGGKKEVKRTARGPEALAVASMTEPTLTCIAMLSIVLDVDEDEVSARMITEELSVYITAVNVAMSLSQGIDPTIASQAMRDCHTAWEANRQAQGEILREQGKAQTEMVLDLMAELVSYRGKTGSSDGSQPEESTTSSST